jgi:cytochrome P450
MTRVLGSIDHVPQVPGLPLFGQLLDFRFARLRVFDEAAKVGPMARIKLGPLDVLVLTDAALAREVLVDQADAFVKSRTLNRFARRLLGNGLLTSEHELHRRQRKLMAPLFSPRVVAGWADEMTRAAEGTIDRWADGDIVDVVDEMMVLTLAIVGRTLLDVDVTSEADWVGRALGVANRQASTEAARLVPLPLSLPTLGRLRNARAIADLDGLVSQLIADRRRTGGTGSDALSLLVGARDEEDGRSMTDGEVRDEVMTLFFAGHETTANLMSWTWLLLAESPETRQRLLVEVDEVLHGAAPSFAALESLPLTLRILKESMRLYPPVYGIGRVAERDVTIGGVRVPQGTTVALNIYGMHRRPDLFPDPEVFDPDRFTPEREAALPRSAYMPFGSGPRVCIGAHFALMEAHLLLATIAQRISLERADRVPRPQPLITLRPDRLPMKVRRRV